MITIAIANQKGGCGKTVTCLNLGAGLSKKYPVTTATTANQNKKVINSRCLFVDTDPQCSLSRSFGYDIDYCKNNKGVLDILTCNLTAKEVVNYVKPIITVKSTENELKYGVITSNKAMYRIDNVISGDDIAYRLKDGLESVKDDFDYCFIDCPPALGTLTINALTAADYVIIPIDVDPDSLLGLDLICENVERIRKGTNPNLNVLGALIVRYKSNTVISRNFAKKLSDIANILNISRFECTIRDCTAIKEARTKQCSIFRYSNCSNAALDYSNLAEEVYNLLREDAKNDKKF